MKNTSTIPSGNLPKILALVGLLIIVFSLVFSDVAEQNMEKQKTSVENSTPQESAATESLGGGNTEGLNIFNTIELFGFIVGSVLLFMGIWTWYHRAQAIWDQRLKKGTSAPGQVHPS